MVQVELAHRCNSKCTSAFLQKSISSYPVPALPPCLASLPCPSYPCTACSDVGANQLTGSLPTTLSQLDQLTHL